MAEYDRFAKGFSASRAHAWPEFMAVSELISDGTKWLDVGCGNGRLRRFVEQGDYTGMDVSEGLLSEAKKQSPEANFVRADFTKKWPFNDGIFSVVVGMASFHHALTKADQTHFMQEAYRVLRPGGWLFLTTWKIPQKHFWPNILRGRWRVWNVPFGKEKHPRKYRRVDGKELRRRAKAAGFAVEKTYLSRGKNYVLLARRPE